MVELNTLLQGDGPDQTIRRTFDRFREIKLNIFRVHAARFEPHQTVKHIAEQRPVLTATGKMRIKLVRVCAKCTNVQNALCLCRRCNKQCQRRCRGNAQYPEFHDDPFLNHSVIRPTGRNRKTG